MGVGNKNRESTRRQTPSLIGDEVGDLLDTLFGACPMKSTRLTEDGRPIVRLRCKPYVLRPNKSWDMFVGHDGTIWVEYHVTVGGSHYTYWDNCHSLSQRVINRVHKLVDFASKVVPEELSKQEIV